MNIPIPQGYKVARFDEKEITLEPIKLPIIERIKNLDDLVKEYGWGNLKFFKTHNSLFSNKGRVMALFIMLEETLNEGHEFKAGEMYHYPKFINDGIAFLFAGVEDRSAYSSAPIAKFKNAKLAEHAGTFLTLYDAFINNKEL